MLSSVPCENMHITQLQPAEKACIGIFARTIGALRSSVVLRLNRLPSFIVVSLVHGSSFFLRMTLMIRLFLLFFPSQLHPSMTNIKNTKKIVIGTTSLAEEGPTEQSFQFRPLVWLIQLPVLSQCSGNSMIKKITVEISFY